MAGARAVFIHHETAVPRRFMTKLTPLVRSLNVKLNSTYKQRQRRNRSQRIIDFSFDEHLLRAMHPRVIVYCLIETVVCPNDLHASTTPPLWRAVVT